MPPCTRVRRRDAKKAVSSHDALGLISAGAFDLLLHEGEKPGHHDSTRNEEAATLCARWSYLSTWTELADDATAGETDGTRAVSNRTGTPCRSSSWLILGNAEQANVTDGYYAMPYFQKRDGRTLFNLRDYRALDGGHPDINVRGRRPFNSGATGLGDSAGKRNGERRGPPWQAAPG